MIQLSSNTFYLKREWKDAMCRHMVGTGDYHTKWSQSDRERQIPHEIAYTWNLKHDPQGPFLPLPVPGLGAIRFSGVKTFARLLPVCSWSLFFDAMNEDPDSSNGFPGTSENLFFSFLLQPSSPFVPGRGVGGPHSPWGISLLWPSSAGKAIKPLFLLYSPHK